MCNLYSMTKNQAAIRDLFKVGRDTAGNLPPLPAIFPDYMAPVVRVSEGERELIMMRWGMPNPPQYPGITTNIRNTSCLLRVCPDTSGRIAEFSEHEAD